MTVIERNGMPAAELGNLAWRKSRYSGANGGNCVEVAATRSGNVAVRHSREPEGPALIYSQDEFWALIQGVRDGEFDSMLRDGRRATSGGPMPPSDVELDGSAMDREEVVVELARNGGSDPS
ncbi:MAG: DUF397 domain-containing protein [Dermatophilaceae bacterium]